MRKSIHSLRFSPSLVVLGISLALSATGVAWAQEESSAFYEASSSYEATSESFSSSVSEEASESSDFSAESSSADFAEYHSDAVTVYAGGEQYEVSGENGCISVTDSKSAGGPTTVQLPASEVLAALPPAEAPAEEVVSSMPMKGQDVRDDIAPGAVFSFLRGNAKKDTDLETYEEIKVGKGCTKMYIPPGHSIWLGSKTFSGWGCVTNSVGADIKEKAENPNSPIDGFQSTKEDGDCDTQCIVGCGPSGPSSCTCQKVK